MIKKEIALKNRILSNPYVVVSSSVKMLLGIFSLAILLSCGGGGGSGSRSDRRAPAKKPRKQTFAEAVSDWRSNKGIGPIKKDMELSTVDDLLATGGMEIFKLKCSACHAPYKEKVGPAMVGITSRRRPEWIMNMILNPVEMAKRDPICVGLLAQYNVVMADQQIQQEDARKLLEYLRTLKLQKQEQAQ